MGCDDIVTRPEIHRFAEAMQVTLDKHQEEKGDSWKKMSFLELKKILHQQITKNIHTAKQGENIKGFVDVANLCMMLWYRQVCVGLEFEEVKPNSSQP